MRGLAVLTSLVRPAASTMARNGAKVADRPATVMTSTGAVAALAGAVTAATAVVGETDVVVAAAGTDATVAATPVGVDVVVMTATESGTKATIEVSTTDVVVLGATVESSLRLRSTSHAMSPTTSSATTTPIA